MYAPLNYEQLNMAAGHYAPALVKSYNNEQFKYWERALYQRIASVIKVTGLPEDWEGNVKDFFFYCLFRFGYVGIFNTAEYGLTFQPGTLYGYNWFYQPSHFVLSNPKMSGRFELGTEAELLKLAPDYQGCFDIICYFAEKLAALDGAISQSIINSRFAWLLIAKNKGAAATLAAAFDKLYRGDPLAIFDRNTILEDDPTAEDGKAYEFIQRTDMSNSYLTSQQLQDLNTILSNFDAEIGINNLPYQGKKERLVTAEANSREEDATARARTWIECLNSSAKNVNKLFGMNLHFELVEPEEDQTEGGIDNAGENDFAGD